MFSILKIKNVKRVCPKRIIKGQKERKKIKKVKNMNPPKKTKINHESVKFKFHSLCFTL